MRIWKEKLNPEKHKDYMSSYTIGGDSIELPKDNLLVKYVYFVKECGFTFQFISLNQIDECIMYFSHKTHPSGREFNDGLEHYWQKWCNRLPGGLTKSPKREKILKALVAAKHEFINER